MLSRFRYIDPNVAVLLVVDHQLGLSQLVRDFTPTEFRNNILAHAALGNVFNLPTILTTSAETGRYTPIPSKETHSDKVMAGPNGPLPKEIIEMHPSAPYIRRNGEVNAWDNPEFRAAVEATGKKQIIIAGIVTEVCAWNLSPSLFQGSMAFDSQSIRYRLPCLITAGGRLLCLGQYRSERNLYPHSGRRREQTDGASRSTLGE